MEEPKSLLISYDGPKNDFLDVDMEQVFNKHGYEMIASGYNAETGKRDFQYEVREDGSA